MKMISVRDQIVSTAIHLMKEGKPLHLSDIDAAMEKKEGYTFQIFETYNELKTACMEQLATEIIERLTGIFTSASSIRDKVTQSKKFLLQMKPMMEQCETNAEDREPEQVTLYYKATSAFQEAVTSLYPESNKYARENAALISYGICGLLYGQAPVTVKFSQLNNWLNSILEFYITGDAQRDYKIFVINPGSTSTKLALFRNETCLFSANVFHDATELLKYPSCNAQFDYRKEVIDQFIADNGIDLSDADAIVGRGGGLVPMIGGVYAINEQMLDDTRNARNGVDHPAMLGPQLAHAYAVRYHIPCFTLNPPDLDEFSDVARMTSIKGVYRPSHLHALNLKEMAIRHAARIGKRYVDCKFIVCHIDGGVSVSAHDHGMMIDGNDIAGGDGPMTPTRCGSISAANMNKLCCDSDYADIRKLYSKAGGFVSHFGTSDSDKVHAMVEAGDHHAVLVWNAFIYQICKNIGAMASVLNGRVDAIILGGGLLRFDDLVTHIRERCEWIAPISVYPGEFENEAMAAGAIRVLKGEEEPKEYTGIPVWDGFEFDQ